MTNQEIAKTIIQQLGGAGRLNMMTGAYNFIAIENGVSFRIKNQRANFIKITLNGLDLYDLEVGRIRGNTYKVVYESNDLYYDMLKPEIEKATGMYLSLFEKGGTMENGNNKNGKYLDSLSSDKKSRILKNIASHYGISVADAEDEVRDEDAEMLYEYIANDKALRMEVYNDMERGKMAKEGGNIRSLWSQFRKEKPSILLQMIADNVVSEFMRKKFDKTIVWSKLSDSEKEKYNAEYRINKDNFEKYVIYEFLKLYYGNNTIKNKCKGQSRTTIVAITSVMLSLAKDYSTDKYAKGGITEHGLEIGDKITGRGHGDKIEGYNKEMRETFTTDLDKGKRSSSRYAKGGKVNNHFRLRGLEFLKDDLGKLENAIQENDNDEIQKFFSYWNQHLDLLETTKNSRLFNFLKDDLGKLENAIQENDNDEIQKFFSYWDYHLQSLKYAKGGKTKKDPPIVRGYFDDEPYEYAKGGGVGKNLLELGAKIKLTSGRMELGNTKVDLTPTIYKLEQIRKEEYKGKIEKIYDFFKGKENFSFSEKSLKKKIESGEVEIVKFSKGGLLSGFNYSIGGL